MLRYIQGHLTSIDGVAIYPIISLIIFFSFFVGLGVYLLRSDKKARQANKNIPLDDN